jgi:hypothetical protein
LTKFITFFIFTLLTITGSGQSDSISYQVYGFDAIISFDGRLSKAKFDTLSRFKKNAFVIKRLKRNKATLIMNGKVIPKDQIKIKTKLIICCTYKQITKDRKKACTREWEISVDDIPPVYLNKKIIRTKRCYF